MIIDQLPPLLVAGDDDEIAIEVGQNTYKIKKSDLLQEFMKKTGGAFTGNVSIGGTLGVTGDTDLGGDLDLTGNATVGGSLDVVSRRCAATLSSAGWYRVIQTSDPSGMTSAIIDLKITRAYTNTDNEAHSIRLIKTYNSIGFADETSRGNVLEIDKVRYTKDNDHGYVDIHYTGASSNAVNVDFSVATNSSLQALVSSLALAAVADAPSGETVLTIYTFDLNANSNPVVVKTHSATASTISGGSQGNCSIPIGLTGYTAIGIVGVTGSGNGDLALSDFYIHSQSEARLYYHNTLSSAKNPTWTISVLYKKD